MRPCGPASKTGIASSTANRQVRLFANLNLSFSSFTALIEIDHMFNVHWATRHPTDHSVVAWSMLDLVSELDRACLSGMPPPKPRASRD